MREPGKIVRDLALLEKKGIEVIKGQVDGIDAERKVVHIDGAKLAPENVPGLAEAGYNLSGLRPP